MSFSSSAYNIKRIARYEDAERHFDDTKERRSRYWQSNWRPLYEVARNATRMVHYRMEREADANGGSYYDLVHYNTALVRYHQPKPDGTREVWVRGFASQSSWAFLRRHGWEWNGSRLATDGTTRRVYLNPVRSACLYVFGDNWSVKLVFDERDRLIVERSRHVPVFLRRSSAEDKQQRARLKRNLDVVVDLAVMRALGQADEWHLDWPGGRPFTGAEVGSRTRLAISTYGRRLAYSGEEDPAPDDETVEAVMDLAMACAGRQASSVLRAAPWGFGSRITEDEAKQRVTHDSLRAAVLRYINTTCVGAGSERKPLPQFPNVLSRLPRTILWSPGDDFSYEDYFNDYPMNR